MMWSVTVTVLFMLSSTHCDGEDHVEIETEYGRIEGNVVPVRTSNAVVHSFYGVPVGKPAVGNLRFAVSITIL